MQRLRAHVTWSTLRYFSASSTTTHIVIDHANPLAEGSRALHSAALHEQMRALGYHSLVPRSERGARALHAVCRPP